jgi:hypothetical protein
MSAKVMKARGQVILATIEVEQMVGYVLEQVFKPENKDLFSALVLTEIPFEKKIRILENIMTDFKMDILFKDKNFGVNPRELINDIRELQRIRNLFAHHYHFFEDDNKNWTKISDKKINKSIIHFQKLRKKPTSISLKQIDALLERSIITCDRLRYIFHMFFIGKFKTDEFTESEWTLDEV